MKQCRGDVRINVFDNSDKRPFPEMDGVRVFDNTHGQLIDFRKFLSGYPKRFGEWKNDWASARRKGIRRIRLRRRGFKRR